MSEHTTPSPEPENEHYPIEPRYHPIHKIPRKIYDFLASSKLAMGLLVAILVCCVVGVTVWRGAEAGRIIFGTLWFNGILVLLVINVACCFFGRIWGRRVTLISLGMILFHLSFVAILLGVIYNSLFCFRGNIRLTEGEILSSSDPASYDGFDKGRFFSFSRLRGDAALVRVHTDFKIGGEYKRVAYEVAVGERADRKQGLVYITNKLSHHGVDYFNDREGYSILFALSDRSGKPLYAGYGPLQSIPQKDSGFIYTTGFKEGNTVIAMPVDFPPAPETARFAFQPTYTPSKLKEREGEVEFRLYPLQEMLDLAKPFVKGKTTIGKPLSVGEYLLEAKEVRYWAVMTVRYEPGKPIVLASLWVGLAGMLLTTVGRMLRKQK